MRVLIDVDGVLADFTRGFTGVAKELGLIQQSWACEEQTEWAFDFNIDKVWKEVDSRWNWWMTLPPLVDQGDVDSINRAIRDHSVYFITNRGRTRGFSAEVQTRLWLGSIGIHADHASTIATRSGTKGHLAKALNLELALDDKPENLEEMAYEDIKVVKRNWLYNQNSPFPGITSIKQFLYEYLPIPEDLTPDGRFHN